MARNGWSGSNVLRLGSIMGLARPLTMSCWGKASSLASIGTMMALLKAASSGNDDLYKLSLNTDGTAQILIGATGATSFASTSTSVSTGVWFQASAVFASATDHRVFLNGGGKGTSSTSRTPGTLDRTAIGNRDNAGAAQAFAGELAHAAIWNIALSDAENAMLAFVSPLRVRPDALVAYWPIDGISSPEINLRSNANAISIVGSLSAANDAPIIRPKQSRRGAWNV